MRPEEPRPQATHAAPVFVSVVLLKGRSRDGEGDKEPSVGKGEPNGGPKPGPLENSRTSNIRRANEQQNIGEHSEADDEQTPI